MQRGSEDSSCTNETALAKLTLTQPLSANSNKNLAGNVCYPERHVLGFMRSICSCSSTNVHPVFTGDVVTPRQPKVTQVTRDEIPYLIGSIAFPSRKCSLPKHTSHMNGLREGL